MKTDLDQLMQQADLDAIIVMGDKASNAYRDYLTNRSKANGSVFKKRGEPAVFVVNSAMELGEAAVSGLTLYTVEDFDRTAIFRKHSGDYDLAVREHFCTILSRLGITGRTAVFGVADLNYALLLVSGVAEHLPQVQLIVGGMAANLFALAYATKDAQEMDELRRVGQLASQIMGEVRTFISGHRAENGTVVNAQGAPLTIGAVKAFIRDREAVLGLENPSGPIFAQGADAGVPHSHGNDAETLQLGKSIVFDYSPKLASSGYYHDMTRTWCIGYAPEDVQTAYDQVMFIFDETKRTFAVGEPTSRYQAMTCDYFEEMGHATLRTNPKATSGYIHSLGHGLGLNIHEAPFMRLIGTEDKLQAGNVFTVEPGLYYPERGYGVRIEDTVCFDADGTLLSLTAQPYELVLPLTG